MTSRSLQEWLTSVEARHPNEIDLGLERISEVWSRIQTKIPEQLRKPSTLGGGEICKHMCTRGSACT